MKKLLAIFSLLVLSHSLLAQKDQDSTYQENEKKFDPNRLVFGGIVGASFGNFTFVQVAPQVGYMFNQYLTAGGGINFIYSSQKFDQGSLYSKYEYGYAGLNVFARAFPIRFIVVSAQPEINYNWGRYKSAVSTVPDDKIEAQFIPSLLLGGGLVIPTGGRGGMMITMQYDVIQNVRSPYGSNAFINIGFTF
jgi:hypothetical protein